MDRASFGALLVDLSAEEDNLDSLVGGLDDADWAAATPAVGWDVRDQIAHLAATEAWASLSLEDPDAFRARLARYADDPVRREAGIRDGRVGQEQPQGTTTLEWWRTNRHATGEALRAREPSDRVPWFGPDMSVTSFTTARIMETWAHGQDVADALGVEREPTARLRHVAEIGVRARPFAYASRDLTVPDDEVRVELVAPDGQQWSWGPTDARDRIVGDALDWCLVATHRRNPADTDLTVKGAAAVEWIGIVQAFAGPPTEHRPPVGGVTRP